MHVKKPRERGLFGRVQVLLVAALCPTAWKRKTPGPSRSLVVHLQGKERHKKYLRVSASFPLSTRAVSIAFPTKPKTQKTF